MLVNRRTALTLGASAFVSLVGCTKRVNVVPDEKATVVKTITDVMLPYNEMSDGTFECNGYSYQYRLEITGRMPNAICDSTYVYLSNIGEISFEKAYMAGGLSSNSEDYFDPEEAVLVDMWAHTED